MPGVKLDCACEKWQTVVHTPDQSYRLSVLTLEPDVVRRSRLRPWSSIHNDYKNWSRSLIWLVNSIKSYWIQLVGDVLFEILLRQRNAIQEVELKLQINASKTDQRFITLTDRILQLWKVITAATVLFFVVLQSSPPGMCACVYVIGHRSASPDDGGSCCSRSWVWFCWTTAAGRLKLRRHVLDMDPTH